METKFICVKVYQSQFNEICTKVQPEQIATMSIHWPTLYRYILLIAKVNLDKFDIKVSEIKNCRHIFQINIWISMDS